MEVNFYLGANQVDIFLEDHGGPGVQHMGLYTPDIMSTVATFKRSGAQFVETPQAYYEDVSIYIAVNILRKHKCTCTFALYSAITY